jgi:hypothetical protein
MASAGEDSPGAKVAGFRIMDSIGARSRRATVNTAVGDQLTKGLIKCMFVLPDPNGFPDFPGGAIYNFAAALNAAGGGSYYTRGDGAGSENVVLATDATTDPDVPDNLSGVAPPSGETWSSILDQHVLLYGFPTSTLPQSATTPLEYEWSTVPFNATWDPGAVVAVCDGDESKTAMVHESNIGVLQFVEVGSICSQSRPTAMGESGWGPSAVVRRLASLFRPTSLQAAVTRTGSGGIATFKSKFKKQNVSNIRITFVNNQPPAGAVAGATFKVAVTVSAVDGTTLTPISTCIYLTGTNNNGFFKDLTGPVDRACNADRPTGIPAGVPSKQTVSLNSTQSSADFGNTIISTGPGGLVITATAKPLGRSGSGSKTAKMNIKPK